MQKVPEGYKKTEVGVIPMDWEVKELNEVTDYTDYRGKTPKKTETGILLITARNVKDGYLDLKTSREYVSEKDYDEIMKRGLPQNGDVLFTTEAPLGNIAQVIDEKIALAQRIIKFRGKTELNNNFLKYYMLGESFQKNIYEKAIGSTVLGIQGKQLHKIKIAIPLLPEQKKIAEILSSVDEQIEVVEAQIEKSKELKKGLMQKLLTGKWTLENGKMVETKEFKKSELGDIPVGWEVKKLGEILKVKHGNAFKSEFFQDFENENILLTPGNFKIGGGFNIQKIKYYSVKDIVPEEYILKENDMIINMTDLSKDGDTLGLPVILPRIENKNLLHNQRLGRLIFKIDIEKKYIFYLLCENKYRKEILAGATGTTVRHTSPNRIEAILVVIPPLSEQQKIAEILSSVDEQIEAKEQKRDKLIELKKGLMQKLLTGKIRVKV